jgi:hypothetical protein
MAVSKTSFSRLFQASSEFTRLPEQCFNRMGFQPVAASFIEQVEGVFERGNQALQFRFEKNRGQRQT